MSGPVVMVALALSAAPALAAPAAVTLDDAKPALEKDGDGHKVSVGLTNVTDAPVTLRVTSTKPAPVSGDGCTVGFPNGNAPTRIPPAQHETVAIHYGAGCTVPDSGVAFSLSTDTGQTIGPLTAAPKPDKHDTPWWVLIAFPIGWILGTIVLAVARDEVLVGGGSVARGAPLTSLPKTWTFGDSWAANITLIGGTLTGVLGSSSVVKAILGKDADDAIALATVGAAISAGMIGLGVIVLMSMKARKPGEPDDYFTSNGLVYAGGLTLGGAFGELFVVWRSGTDLTLGGLEDWLWAPALAVSVLLVVYACRNLQGTIRVGATPAAKVPVAVPEGAVAAAVLLEHFKGADGATPEEVIAEIKRLLNRAEGADGEGAAQARTMLAMMAAPPMTMAPAMPMPVRAAMI